MLCKLSKTLGNNVIHFSLSFSSQDGKTAEDLAYADQHEPIVSLLGKLKKVKGDTRTQNNLSINVTGRAILHYIAL